MRVYEFDEEYGEYLADLRAAERAAEEERLNRADAAGYAPADFLYDPLSKRGFE